MIENSCERESAVVIAARSGEWPADLESHIAVCSACAETRRVAQLFRQAAKLSTETQPPPAAIAWQRLEARRQQQALKRATRCIALLWVLAGVYAVALAAWSLPQLCHMPSSHLTASLIPLSSGIFLAGVVTSIVAVLIGSCCLVLLGSRTNFRLHI
jgi:hypothetical protein